MTHLRPIVCAIHALLCIVVAVAAPGAAADVVVLPLAPGDLAATELRAPVVKGLPAASREPVTFSWGVDTDLELTTAVQPHTSVSSEYWLSVTAAGLNRGVEVPTVSSRALVRINPVGPADRAAGAAVDPMSLVLLSPDHREHQAGAGMELLVTADQLRAADAPFPEGTSAFRIAEELGAGAFIVRAPYLAPSAQPYLVHVFEPASDVRLTLGTGQDTYFAGSRVWAVARLESAGRPMTVDSVDGAITSPSGVSQPVEITRSRDGSLRISGVVGGRQAPLAGLWELQLTATGRVDDLVVRRGVRTAFAMSTPTARLTGTALLRRSEGTAVSLGIEVEAAAAGRYELRGVLHGTGPDGMLRPAAVAHSAAWLDAGRTPVELSFDAAVLAATELSAPWEIRDLRLIDQGRMALLHRQARAIMVRK